MNFRDNFGTKGGQKRSIGHFLSSFCSFLKGQFWSKFSIFGPKWPLFGTKGQLRDNFFFVLSRR